ncbi:MAG: SecY interacting protein Syd [Psychromonas sp.]|jgi:SecY interacting protein Syd|uniref:SecY-interacting protein n=1 Tax=Psychromonas sp. TaxID=1884585 RepID=UPI0039E46EA2
MNNTIQAQLFALFERQQALWQQQKQSLPMQIFDSEWISPCQVGDVKDGKIEWSAVKREPSLDLSNIEQALEIKLHPSISDFFCSAYADSVPCLFSDHPITLIQAWNEDDFKLLQTNMIAHFMMQKRLKEPASMFIASCSDEMQIISIANETGQVQLETLGKGQDAILAENLTDFLAQLVPVILE